MNKNKGFTLIELLVVVAIIVILAMIVFPGVRTATQKANDARVISEMSQIRTQAEMYFTNNNKYYVSDTDNIKTMTEIVKLKTDIDSKASATSTIQVETGTNSDAYCAYVTLNEKVNGTTVQYMCIDSNSSTYKGVTDPLTTCTATAFVCPAS